MANLNISLVKLPKKEACQVPSQSQRQHWPRRITTSSVDTCLEGRRQIVTHRLETRKVQVGLKCWIGLSGGSLVWETLTQLRVTLGYRTQKAKYSYFTKCCGYSDPPTNKHESRPKRSLKIRLLLFLRNLIIKTSLVQPVISINHRVFILLAILRRMPPRSRRTSVFPKIASHSSFSTPFHSQQ
jgi:hypothetical protein